MSLLDLAYLGALTVASPYLLYKAVTRPRHLEGLRARLSPPEVRAGDAPCVWVHGVSVGEVVAAEPLVRGLATALPGHEVVVTTSTSTGQAVARRKYPGRRIGYFPIDFSWAVRRVFDAVRPSLVILVELELWPNFLAEARARGVPVIVVNGRISERSFGRYRFLRRLLPLFDQVSHYGVQTEQYAERFRALGVDPAKITVTGTMKYDGVQTLPPGAPSPGIEARASLGIEPDERVWIAGSTHAPEERQLVDVHARLRVEHPRLRLVLAPRHNERAEEVRRLVEAAGLKPVLRSQQLKAPGSGPADRAPLGPLPADAVVVLDTLGELSRLYAAADLVFVGGSLMPHGGQNILEPAALGKPVLFGPHVQNFQESVDRLLAARGALQVRDAQELEARLRELLSDRQAASALGARGLAAIEAAKGATERTLGVLRPYVALRRDGAHETRRPEAGQDGREIETGPDSPGRAVRVARSGG